MEISAATGPASTTDAPQVMPPVNPATRAAFPAGAQGASQSPQQPIQNEASLLRALLQALQSSSGGASRINSLLSDLEQANTLPATPDEVRREISQTLSAAAPLRRLGSDAAILKALSQAPLSTDPRAGSSAPEPATEPFPPASEFKSALASLHHLTRQWNAGAPGLQLTPAPDSGKPLAAPGPPAAAQGAAGRAEVHHPLATDIVGAATNPTPTGTRSVSDLPPALLPLAVMSPQIGAAVSAVAPSRGGIADAMVSLLLSQQAIATPPESLNKGRNPRTAPQSPDSPEHRPEGAGPGHNAYRKAQPASPVQAATPWPPDPGTPFIVRTIAARAEAALNQIRLLETAALLHQAEQATAGAQASEEPRWTFDLPLQTPFGEALARFEVARDGVRTRNGTHAVVWRARFSMDVEPLGPVHAQIALMGKHAWVSLWAEREASMSLLEQQQAGLKNAFSAGSIEAEVICCLGKPPARPAGSGAVWDGEV